ncbi:MAG: DUF885 domain-containing protein [Candidatus Dormibacteria bacterium]
MSRLDDLARGYQSRLADLDPNYATQRGILGHDGELTDYSPDGEGAREELRRTSLARLEQVPDEEPHDRLARTVMRERLQVHLDLFQSREWLRELSVFGPMVETSRVFDLMARETDADWDLIAQRMSQVPQALAGIRATLRLGAESGRLADRHQAEITSARARRWAGNSSEPGFFRQLAQSYPHRDEARASRLQEEGARADRAYLDFGEFLERDYLPLTPAEEGCGPEAYGLGCRLYNGMAIDAQETYDWGWEELRRLRGEMDRTAQRILPGASLSEAIQLLDRDPARAVEGEDNLRRWLQDFMDQTMSQLEGTHFDIPEPVQRVEAMLAPPGGSPAMYYTPPSEDFSRPGRTWYPTMGRTRFPLWTEVSVAYHEGVPGHHLQLGQICYLSPHLNPFQGLLGLISGQSEGWALYAELLMGELGFLENPDHYLGMLAMQAFRAARVVLDIGLHLHLQLPPGQPFHPGEIWTRPLAVEFLLDLSARNEDFVRGEVDRYLGVPGQAISYKLGERVWLEVREAAKRNWGGQFSLKAFHRQALNLGSLGLEQLRQEMAQPQEPAPPGD